jgi:hypothetical protein
MGDLIRTTVGLIETAKRRAEPERLTLLVFGDTAYRVRRDGSSLHGTPRFYWESIKQEKRAQWFSME